MMQVMLAVALFSAQPSYTYSRLFYGASASQFVDVYASSSFGAPTIIGIHGGGWSNVGPYKNTFESQEYLAELAPFFSLGWNVANVEYRGSETAPAPAAFVDVRCAVGRLVVGGGRFYLMGHSAGGHLALMEAASVDPPQNCAVVTAPVKFAAVINWYGISDVTAIMDAAFAKNWFSDVPNAGALAYSLSPVFNLTAAMPPVITLHGIGDPVVPFEQSARLHARLDELGVRNRLVAVNVNTHGKFSAEQLAESWADVMQFIADGTKRHAAKR